MSGPTLEQIAADVLAQEGDEFHGLHKLVVVRGISEGDFEAALLEIPAGIHPLDALVGMRCPPMVIAAGVVAYGWAADASGGRPSEADDRTRVRIVHLHDRMDRAYALAVLEDGRVIDEPGEGAVPDALREALGLAPHQLG